MPELSRFFGIAIEVESWRIHGWLPPRVERMVLDWAQAHEAELIENWQRVRARLPVVPIPPLE